MRGIRFGRAALLAIVTATGCAQILDADKYRVDPDAFDTDDSVEVDASTKPVRDSGTKPVVTDDETDDTDDTPAPVPSMPDPQPTEAGAPGPTPDPTVTEPPDSGPAPGPTQPGPGPTAIPGAGGGPAFDGGRPKPPEGAGGMGGAGGGGPILPPGCTPPVAGECDTRAQCGCEPGEMCRVVDISTGETGCAAAGSTAPYAACINNTDCQAGYACIASVCKQLCDGEVTNTCAQGPYATCEQVTYDGANVPGYYICLRTCDPLNPSNDADPYDACGSGASCVPGRAGVSYCIAAGTGVTDDPCETADGDADPFACAEGYACVIKQSGAVCKPNCDVAADDCPNGNTCFSYITPVGAADVEIGYCDSCPSLPPNGTCDPVSQCGCGSTEMCAIIDFDTGEAGCLPQGSVPQGGACSETVGECEQGSECLQWNSTGVCSAFCDDASDCASGACVEWDIPGVMTCLHGCDPRNPQSSADGFSACAAGQSCGLWETIPDSSVCIVPTTAGQEGDSCGDDDECGPALTCADDGGSTTCQPWCELGSGDCAPGEACLPHTRIGGELEVAGVRFGICTEPLIELENNTKLAIPDPADGYAGVTGSSVTLTAPPAGIKYIQVEVDITHPWIGDIDLHLLGPDPDSFVRVHSGDVFTGTALASADDFTGTIFGDDAITPITEGLAPFTGFFQTYEPLNAFVDLYQTQAAWAGEWTLAVYDLSDGDTGTLNSWKIRFY